MKRVLPALALALAACNAVDGGATFSHHDRGTLCLVPRSEGSVFPGPEIAQQTYTYPAGEPVSAIVFLEGTCLSSSCDIMRKMACTFSSAGGELTVTSTLSWEQSGADACTTDCGIPSARCDSPPLAAGTYTVSFGTGAQATLTVGTSTRAVCVKRL